MLNKKKVVVVLPAYNAAKTLRRTVDEIPREIVDEVILTDDASRDNTSDLALELGLITSRTTKTRATAATRKPAIRRRWRGARISWSCSTRTTSTRPSWFPPWPR